MGIVFMGTPEIGKICLERMLSDGYHVSGVYTQPDRPKNRGMKLEASPVKQAAQKAGIPIFQPERFRDPETVEAFRALQPELAVVVAYGRILPQSILDIPKYGCINIHASLLPAYRGAAPYQWAVLNGETVTGVTAMYLSREMDAGDIIDAVSTPIGPDETAGELLERLSQLGAELLSKTLPRILDGTAPRTPQDGSRVSFAPMLDKSLCPIDWNRPAAAVHNQVRGLNPWPVATAELGGTHFKIYETARTGEPADAPAGTILGLTRTGLRVACADEALEVRCLQAQGGRRMAAPDYFRGHPLEG